MNMDKQYFCHTHLGHLLNPGDLVLGFDLANCNLNDEHVNKMKSDRVLDVVLIKKSYDHTKRQCLRNWKRKELARDRENMDTDDERSHFLYILYVVSKEILMINLYGFFYHKEIVTTHLLLALNINFLFLSICCLDQYEQM